MDLAANINKDSTSFAKVDCPLCGFQFPKDQAACCGCAMMKGCTMLKCPNCHYEFVTESKVVEWIRKALKRWD